MRGFLARLGLLLDQAAVSFGLGPNEADVIPGCIKVRVDSVARVDVETAATASIRVTREECS